MSDFDRKIGLTQIVSPFGVGGIWDYRGESLVAMDTGHWAAKDMVDVPAERLAAALGVARLRRPRAVASIFAKTRSRVPYARFPRWLFCARCRRLRMRDGWGGGQARCDRCQGAPQLVPMRFVVACEAGHLGDVDWVRWAHKDSATRSTCKVKDLRFRTRRGVGTGLASLEVACEGCSASATLEGLTSGAGLRSIGQTCPGKQPWQHQEDAVKCEKPAVVVQRGASNLYFAEVESALEIPEGPPRPSDPLVDDIRAHRSFETLVHDVGEGGAIADQIAGIIADKVGCDREMVLEVAFGSGGGAPEVPVASMDRAGIRDLEWAALTSGQAIDAEDFVARPTDFLSTALAGEPVFSELGSLVGSVVLVDRLREVRALEGFRRLKPDASQPLVRPGLREPPLWLPAIEVYGEGVFVSLDEARVRAWEIVPEVVDRAEGLEARRDQSFMGGRARPGAVPRFLLLHTLAHLLIRQLAFECGYAAASLRERIYCRVGDDASPGQAGLLIYTAAGDVEGTLGGLVRQGEPPRLAQTVIGALDAGRWCSADPICGESRGQGFDELNMAACHACALVAETSCDHGNIILDRAMVVGSEATGFPGFFAEPLRLAIEESARRAQA